MNQTCWYVFHVIVNANSIVQITFQIIKWNNDYSWTPSTCICENSKHLTSNVDDLVSVCDENINFTGSVSLFNENANH